MRQEEWRFTNVAAIADTPFRLADKAPTNAAELRRARARFPTRRRASSSSTATSAPELSSVDGAAAGRRSPAAWRRRLPTAAPEVRASRPARVGARAVRRAQHRVPGGWRVRRACRPNAVVAGADSHRRGQRRRRARRMAHPRTLIVAGANSQAQIAQTFLGAPGEAHFTNAVTEVVGRRRTPSSISTPISARPTRRITSPRCTCSCERSATFRTRTITLGGKLLRNDIVAVLAGEGAHCTLDGCYLVDGERLVDNHTTIDHATPHCTSHELYKGILDGRARAVFNGRIIVRADAQKTDAKQTNRALLLSDEAQINSNPQLEIFADDVKCTHGAAIGQLDEEALFYLRARGLTARDARDMLIHAYAGEVLEGIGDRAR